jgi:hypothetical protein
MVYGRSSAQIHGSKMATSAAEIMRGSYTPEQLLPDKDLEKSITPGFRNINTETRAFGCPSIRTDLPGGNRRSLLLITTLLIFNTFKLCLVVDQLLTRIIMVMIRLPKS